MHNIDDLQNNTPDTPPYTAEPAQLVQAELPHVSPAPQEQSKTDSLSYAQLGTNCCTPPIDTHTDAFTVCTKKEITDFTTDLDVDFYESLLKQAEAEPDSEQKQEYIKRVQEDYNRAAGKHLTATLKDLYSDKNFIAMRAAQYNPEDSSVSEKNTSGYYQFIRMLVDEIIRQRGSDPKLLKVMRTTEQGTVVHKYDEMRACNKYWRRGKMDVYEDDKAHVSASSCDYRYCPKCSERLQVRTHNTLYEHASGVISEYKILQFWEIDITFPEPVVQKLMSMDMKARKAFYQKLAEALRVLYGFNTRDTVWMYYAEHLFGSNNIMKFRPHVHFGLLPIGTRRRKGKRGSDAHKDADGKTIQDLVYCDNWMFVDKDAAKEIVADAIHDIDGFESFDLTVFQPKPQYLNVQGDKKTWKKQFKQHVRYDLRSQGSDFMKCVLRADIENGLVVVRAGAMNAYKIVPIAEYVAHWIHVRDNRVQATMGCMRNRKSYKKILRLREKREEELPEIVETRPVLIKSDKGLGLEEIQPQKDNQTLFEKMFPPKKQWRLVWINKRFVFDVTKRDPVTGKYLLIPDKMYTYGPRRRERWWEGWDSGYVGDILKIDKPEHM